MLLALLMVLISVLFGVSVASSVKLFSSFLARLALAIPLGMASFSFVNLALYVLLGNVTTLGVSCAMAVLLAASIVLYAVNGKNPRSFFLGKHLLFDLPRSLQIAILFVFVVISTIFAYSLSGSNGSVYCIDAGCGDISYHIGIGNSLVYYGFPPKYPFTVATTNVYPFISDFFSALLLKGGLGLVPSIMVPDLLLVFSMVALATMLSYRLLKDSFASVCSLLVFWFGGNGIMQFIEYPFKAQVAVFFQPAHLLYVNGATAGIAGFFNTLYYTSSEFITFWVPIINTMLIAQRDFLLGLPLGIAIVLVLADLVLDEKGSIAKTSWRSLLLIGVMAGMLPLVHPPTLVVVMLFGAFVLFYSLAKSRDKAAKALIAIVPMLLLATPQLLFMNSQNRAQGFFGPEYSLTVNAGNLPLTVAYTAAYDLFFWTDVVGVALITGIAGFILAGRRLKLLSAPFLALIVLVTFFRILPNPADSNKIFVYAFLFLSILTGYAMLLLWRRGPLAKAIAISVMILITLNYAFIFYVHDVSFPQILYSSAEMNATRFIINSTAQDAVFAVSNYVDLYQPVSSVAARTTLISILPYVNGLYTYPVSEVVDANNEIFANGSCSVIREFNVSYVYLLYKNESERSVFENANFSLVYGAYDSERGQSIGIFRAHC